MVSNRDFQFEYFLSGAVSKNSIGGVVGIILLGALALFFIGFGISIPLIPLIVVGLIPIGGIFLCIYRFKGDLKGSGYWVDLFVKEPLKIVWIKPVNVKTTAYHLVTLYSEMHFQICTSDGLRIMIKVDNPNDQRIFLNGIKQYIPYAQFGYSQQIENIYDTSKENFVPTLQKHNLYYPVHALEITQ